VAKIFGFDREMEALRRQVRELSWDAIFGMWTRGAFLQFCQVMPRGRRVVAFLDLDELHDLNERLGYTEVDRRVRATFSMPFRRSDIVARWYSGDEIVILFDSDRAGAEAKIAQLVTSAAGQGLTFSHQVGEWEVGKEAIEEVIGALAEQVTGKKIAGSETGSKSAAEAN
jgi:GGDEF domain-containing protein